VTRRALLWLIPLALLIAATGVAVFFTATESGLRLLWPRLARMLPGELSVESMEGRLTGPIELHGLRYRQDGTSLAIERVSANWQPGALLFGKLRITQLHAEGVALTLPAAPDEPAPAPLTMPALPLTLSVADARLSRISVGRGGDAPVYVEAAEFDFRLDERALEIHSLKAHAATLRLDARGRITLAGEITADLRTDWSVTLPGTVELRGGGTITGSLAELHLDQRVEVPASARLQAVLRDWPAQPHWEARLEIEETDARQLNASWPEFVLRTAAEGKGDFRNWSIEGNFQLRQEQYGKLDGVLTLRHTPEYWTLEHLEIRMPDGAARLNAKAQYPTLGATRELKLDAEWRALVWPLAGDAAIASRQGRLRLAGTPERYTMRLEAAVAGRHVPSADLTIRGRGDISRLNLDRIEARLLDGHITGQGHIAWRPDLAWQLSLTGDALDPGRHWRDWPGRLAIEAGSRGTWRGDRLRADLSIGRTHGMLRGQKISARGALHVDGDNYRLSDLAVDMGEARLRAAGVLNDSWNLGWEARADNLAALLPARGTITSEGRVTGPRAAPRMVVTAHVRDLVMEPHRLAHLDADIHLDLQTHAHDLEGRLTLTLDNGDRIEGRVRLPGLMARAGVMKSQPIEGELSARLSRLELLPALFPDVEDTRGELHASLALGGTLGDPRITGRVTLADGTAQVPRLGLTLKAIELTAESDGQNRIRFEGRLSSGGELRFNGRMQWPSGDARDWSAELALKGERVEAVKIPEAWVLVSPDLRLRARPRRVDVEGELVVPEARIEPLQTSAAVPVSRDVILVNAPDDLATGRTPWDLHSQVRVTLGDKVRFKGFGLTGNITGSVTATDEPEKITTARGELNVNAGKYQAYGRDLDVERGRLIFAGGPIDNPGIDARAVRRVGEVLAGISVRGTLKSPVLTLFSDPPMPQTDILSYLILGQPLQQASTAEGRTLLGAASALTLTGGDRLARDIGARFGFEEVAIQTSGTPGEASLVVGRYLSPKLFIAYSVGLFEQINLLRLRYQLSSRWTVQTETGTYSGADLLFTIER
jgi:autotransporter translocation and assembly factor TamB